MSYSSCCRGLSVRRQAARLLLGAAVLGSPLRARAQVQAPDPTTGRLELPEPLPPNVQRTRVVEALPASRYYFNPVHIRSHFGLRVALGGGVQYLQAEPTSALGGTFHLDVAMVGRVIRRSTARPFGRLWQTALWNSVGYSYTYSAAEGAGRHLFAGGFGVGVHKAGPPAVSDSGSTRETTARVALGWTPHILLGRAQGEFALGARSVFSLELFRHLVGIHLTYDFIHIWNGAFVHDGSLSISIDPFGLIRQ